MTGSSNAEATFAASLRINQQGITFAGSLRQLQIARHWLIGNPPKEVNATGWSRFNITIGDDLPNLLQS